MNGAQMGMVGLAMGLGAFVGCATTPARSSSSSELAAPSATPTRTITHYSGTLTRTSPDGSIPYGPPAVAVVKRIEDPTKGEIIEWTLDEGALRKTILTQTESNTFAATDEEHSFEGNVVFAPSSWQPTGWTYDIRMADGSGRIEGAATIDAEGMRTEKFFVTPDGQRRVRIVDDLYVIDETEYDRLMKEHAM